MERRVFLRWVGVGSLASFLPVAIVACNSESESETSTASPSGTFESIGTVAQLEQTGQLNVKVGDATAIVQRDPTNNNLVAVNPICTHRGCELAWQANESTFVCPCHNAKFGATGEVLQGPAERPLVSYPVKTEGNSILLQKS